MPTELRFELIRFAAALRRREAVHGSVLGVIASLALGLLAALAARLVPLWELYDVLLALLWGTLASALIGGVLGYLWPRPWPSLLRNFDRQLGLADRCITAWELTQGTIHAAPLLAQAQIQDTVRSLRRHEPQEAYSLQFTKAMRTALPVLLLLLVPALTLPNPQREALARKNAQRQAVAAAVEHITELQADLAQAPTLSEEERAEAREALNAALAALNDRHSTPEAQQAALGEAERRLAALRTPADTARVQRIASAAPLSTEEIVQPLSDALARGDLQAAADYLNRFTDSQGRQLTPEEALALADAFNQMADSLQNQDQELASQFRSVAKEIYTGDAQGAREALQKAASTLSQAAQAEAHNQTLEQAQAQLQQAQAKIGGQQSAAAQAGGQQGSGQPGNGQSASAGQMGGGQQGNQAGQGNGTQSGGSNGQGNGDGAGAGGAGHHEDSGSSAALGEDSASRLNERGGELTIPRSVTHDGTPTKQIGMPDVSRVPYRDVYADYSQDAEAELSRRAYPPAMRSYVQQYFSGLAP